MKQLFLSYLITSFCHLFIFRFDVKGETEKSKINSLELKLRDEFDWAAYLELYPDVGKMNSTREQAIEHYLNYGSPGGRVFPSIYPNQPGYSLAITKLTKFVAQMNQQKIPINQRTFVIFHVGIFDNRDSLEVITNNLKIFNYSMVRDHTNSSNFYWFNVIGGKENNIGRLVPSGESQENVARVEWFVSPSDLFTHLRTLNIVKNILVFNFSSVFFMNHGVRGPMILKNHGLWLQEFRELLSDKDHVGIAGSTYSCEIAPHAQSHAFILRTSVIPAILTHYNTSSQHYRNWMEVITYYEIGMSQFLLQNGWNISSLFHKKRFGKNYLDESNCPPHENPCLRCDLTKEDLIFFKYGGGIFRQSGLLCDNVREYMRKETERLAEEEMKDDLILSETVNGGPLFDLFKQYDLELQQDYQAKKNRQIVPIVNRKDAQAEKVCFLIRTTKLHDETQKPQYGTTGSIQAIVASLLRQTDPNWEAFFFLINEKHFDERLKAILHDNKDDRLTFLDVPLEDRLSNQADCTAVDYVLRMLLQREDCRWLSASNADNIYGSEVVERVRNVINQAKFSQNSRNHDQMIPDLVITPLDSRNWAEIDHLERDSKSRWDERCVGISYNIKLNLLAATIQPRPIVGRIDLASAFFNRLKLLGEDLYFGNFTDSYKYPCKGCRGGYFIEYLVKYRYWSYRRLAIDGLKSIVFHGPSPSWCIASGNVWVDHPDLHKVRCLPQRTTNSLRWESQGQIYDWNHFEQQGNRVCLRLNHHGFNQTNQ